MLVKNIDPNHVPDAAYRWRDHIPDHLKVKDCVFILTTDPYLEHSIYQQIRPNELLFKTSKTLGGIIRRYGPPAAIWVVGCSLATYENIHAGLRDWAVPYWSKAGLDNSFDIEIQSIITPAATGGPQIAASLKMWVKEVATSKSERVPRWDHRHTVQYKGTDLKREEVLNAIPTNL